MELLVATENSCAEPDKCTRDLQGKLTKMCAAHRALLSQRFLDGILASRRRRADIWREEMEVD